ncbi:MAG: type II secretion system protein GspJ [Deltaproteobacteria bacterium]
MKTFSKTQDGFTLLEVLLSLAIFSLIALETINHIKIIRNTKDTAFIDIDAYSNTRAAINAMENDLRQAFHVLIKDLGEDAQQSLSQAGSVAHTLFDGRKSEIIFTSLSHRNYFVGKRESEQTEISFFLQSSKKSNYSTLLKRESELIDDNLYEGGGVYTLLENVISLEFQYFDPKTEKWQDSWNSDSGNFRDKFPSAVKIKLVAASGKGKPITVETQFKVSLPNNEPLLVQF